MVVARRGRTITKARELRYRLMQLMQPVDG